jgi:hypothetical protein
MLTGFDRVSRRPARALSTALALVVVATGAARAQGEAPITIWVQKNYAGWENPLHSELSLNTELVNIFSADSFEPIQSNLKNGWNVITVITRPQEPATRGNELIFRIGPMVKDRSANQMVMTTVLWEFRNGSDWDLDEGKAAYSHALGPGVKEVKQEFAVYYAGLELEAKELQEGDYILAGKPEYAGWSSPLTTTVAVNGAWLNTFMLAERQVVITSLIKPGKNELKIVSNRVANTIRDNDYNIMVAGPAEWNVSEKRFNVAPIVEAKAEQGWRKDDKTGQLVNPAAPDSSTIERTIPFVIKAAPAP